MSILKNSIFSLFFVLSCSFAFSSTSTGESWKVFKGSPFKNIMVSLGPYSSHEEALRDESLIDWSNDLKKANAITVAFASRELQHHFELIDERIIIRKYNQHDVKNSIVLISETLLKKNHPKISRRVDFEILEDQGFAIVSENNKNIYIVARTRIGQLYGTYELLSKMGFSWYNPEETIVPRKIRGNLKSYEVLKTPMVDLRGFWTFAEKDLPENYVLWLARNKFNITGKTKPYLGQKLGIKIWGGEHNLIQEEFSKDGLFEKHPEWFTLNKNKRWKVAAKGNYVNPSFANKEVPEYFSKRLIERLETGDLKDIDILNIWPSDRKGFRKDESEYAMGIGNFSDTLLYFYLVIAENLEKAYESNILSRKVTLAGISYHQTLEPPSNLKITQQLETKDYIHVFYPSTRDWTYALNNYNSKSHSNLKLLEGIDSWRVATNFKSGFVQYNYKSNYSGIAITNHKNFAADFDYFFPERSELYAYMHPVDENPGPLELTNALIANMCWKKPLENSKNIQEQVVLEFFDKKYGKWAADWRALFNQMMKATSNAKLIFEAGSLSSILFQNIYWAKPMFTEEEAFDLISRYRGGGEQNLPDGYTFSTEKFYATQFIGLDESIEILREQEVKWSTMFRGVKDLEIRARMQNDIAWFETTQKRYELMALCCDLASKKHLSENSSKIEEQINDNIAFLSKSKTIANVFSPVSSKGFLEVVRKFLAEER